MFNTYLRDNVLRQGVESWCTFVRRFTVPDRIDESIWQVNDYPMLVLNLEVNLNYRRRRDKPPKGKTKPEDEVQDDKKDEEPIRYEPTITQVIAVLTKPLEWLVETLNGFYQLEKDLVPLVDIDRNKAYEIDATNEWIEWGVKNINDYVQKGYIKANEILESFRKYSFLMDKSVSQVIKQLFGDPKDKPNIVHLEREEIHSRL